MKHLPYFFFDYWDNQHVSLGVISIFTLCRLSFSAAVSECRFMPIEQFLGYIMEARVPYGTPTQKSMIFVYLIISILI
jgi:hypothetical protein